MQYGCADITYFQPTGATAISSGSSENPFGVICWKVPIAISAGDIIRIQIIGGCTGCAFIDNATYWGLAATCS